MVRETSANPGTLTGWWARRGPLFVVTTAIVAAALVVAGWTSGLREVMHGALLTLAVAAFLPFVLVAGGLLAAMLIAFILALPAALSGDPAEHGLSGAGDAVVEGGGWLIPRYYGFLARRRHPVFWGVPAGVLLGGLALWGMIAVLVLPGEARTVRALAAAKAGIERAYREAGGFPRPDERGHLPRAAVGGPDALASGVLEDAFGRPLVYEVVGRWKLASWTLTSLGFDGERSADDLCVSGSTRLMAWAEQAQEVARRMEAIETGSAALDDRLAGIRALRCPAK